MIAPSIHHSVPDRPTMRRAHAVAIEQDQRRFSKRFERLVDARPELAVATAVVLGVAIGWLVKRKQW